MTHLEPVVVIVGHPLGAASLVHKPGHGSVLGWQVGPWWAYRSGWEPAGPGGVSLLYQNLQALLC